MPGESGTERPARRDDGGVTLSAGGRTKTTGRCREGGKGEESSSRLHARRPPGYPVSSACAPSDRPVKPLYKHRQHHSTAQNTRCLPRNARCFKSPLGDSTAVGPPSACRISDVPHPVRQTVLESLVPTDRRSFSTTPSLRRLSIVAQPLAHRLPSAIVATAFPNDGTRFRVAADGETASSVQCRAELARRR
jgi:hypothetical protein